MSALKGQALFEAGRLQEAITSLGDELRSDPTDTQRRTFLFELLCFAGEFERAEKQLDVLARSNRDAQMGALLYRSALHAARIRRDMFASGELPPGRDPGPVRGTLNGEPFESISDADPRIGGRFEVFAAGQYTWIPFAQIASVQMQPPRRLRDLLWTPARIRTGPDFRDAELGEVLIPAVAPLSWRHDDPEVRLGRRTVAATMDGQDVLLGGRMLLVDDELFPILELRDLRILSAANGD